MNISRRSTANNSVLENELIGHNNNFILDDYATSNDDDEAEYDNEESSSYSLTDDDFSAHLETLSVSDEDSVYSSVSNVNDKHFRYGQDDLSVFHHGTIEEKDFDKDDDIGLVLMDYQLMKKWFTVCFACGACKRKKYSIRAKTIGLATILHFQCTECPSKRSITLMPDVATVDIEAELEMPVTTTAEEEFNE